MSVKMINGGRSEIWGRPASIVAGGDRGLGRRRAVRESNVQVEQRDGPADKTSELAGVQALRGEDQAFVVRHEELATRSQTRQLESPGGVTGRRPLQVA